MRVVFDGAAEYHGTSINKNLLKGPNYLVNLVGVLLRFKRVPVPICADIEKMYHLHLPTLNIDFDELPTERTLGVLWDNNSDSYVFRVLFNVDISVAQPSDFRRVKSRAYDPLGLVSPVIFLRKVLMQEI